MAGYFLSPERAVKRSMAMVLRITEAGHLLMVGGGRKQGRFGA